MIQHDDPKVQRVGEVIAEHLSEIEILFKPGTKLTLVARRPCAPDGSQDMIVTADDIEDVIAALEKRRTAERRA